MPSSDVQFKFVWYGNQIRTKLFGLTKAIYIERLSKGVSGLDKRIPHPISNTESSGLVT